MEAVTYLNTLRKLAAKYGGILENRKSGHYRITLPNGRYVTCSVTPRCPFAARRVEQDLKRLEKGV